MRAFWKSILAWITAAAIFVTAGIILAGCLAQPADADNAELDGVRIQYFDIRAGYCVVATHDTMQGTSIAMWCTN